MRPERRSAAGMKGGAQPPFAPILAESGKSREREGSALAVRAFVPYYCAAVFVHQLRGRHFSTCP
jgi:hypothetical protein